MTDPKSMERLAARFETFRDREPVGLLYSEWSKEIEGLDPTHLPPTFKDFERQTVFRFSPAPGMLAMLIVGCSDQTLKRLVMASCKDASKELHNDLCDHGFVPDVGIIEINWLWSLIEAAEKDYLGVEGFVHTEPLYQFKNSNCTVNESVLRASDFHQSMEDVVPRKFQQLKSIVESSLRLIEHLSNEPETKPEPKRRGNNTEERLKALWHDDRAFCLLRSIDEIAKRIGRAKSSVSDSDFWDHTIQPAKVKAGTSQQKLARLRNKASRGEMLSEKELQTINNFKEYNRDAQWGDESEGL